MTHAQPSRNARDVVYVPPTLDVVRDFARAACQKFAENDPEFADPVVVDGFTGFLTFYVELVAKLVNKGHHDLIRKESKASGRG